MLHVKHTLTFQKLKHNVFILLYRSNETDLNRDHELNTDRTQQEEMNPEDLCVGMLQLVYICYISVQKSFSVPVQ